MFQIESNWAWAAGLFDGEGHISCRNRTGQGHLPRHRSPRSIVLTINQHHEEVLDRFLVVTGDRMNKFHFTKTRPARSKLSGTYDSWGIRTGKRENILYIVEHMWPWLGSVKRLQAAEAIVLHTSLDPQQLQVVPPYLQSYYQDRAGDTRKDG